MNELFVQSFPSVGMELGWQELSAGAHYNWLFCLTKYYENRSRNGQPHEFHLNYTNLNFKNLFICMMASTEES